MSVHRFDATVSMLSKREECITLTREGRMSARSGQSIASIIPNGHGEGVRSISAVKYQYALCAHAVTTHSSEYLLANLSALRIVKYYRQ